LACSGLLHNHSKMHTHILKICKCAKEIFWKTLKFLLKIVKKILSTVSIIWDRLMHFILKILKFWISSNKLKSQKSNFSWNRSILVIDVLYNFTHRSNQAYLIVFSNIEQIFEFCDPKYIWIQNFSSFAAILRKYHFESTFLR